MSTATEQFAQFLMKGYAPVKWLLKYLCAVSALRIFDWGKTFPQFYSAFTKRLDTVSIFTSTVIQKGYEFCIELAMKQDPKSMAISQEIKKRLHGFNEFMRQNILPLTNNPVNKPRDIWLKVEAVCNLIRELEVKGKKVGSLEDPEFQLKWYQYEHKNSKLPSVDTMASDLADLDKRLNRRGRGGYYNHQQRGYPTHNTMVPGQCRYPHPNANRNYQWGQQPKQYQNQSYPYQPNHPYQPNYPYRPKGPKPDYRKRNEERVRK